MATVTFNRPFDMSTLSSFGNYDLSGTESGSTGPSSYVEYMASGSAGSPIYGIGLVGSFTVAMPSTVTFTEGTANAAYFFVGRLIPAISITGISLYLDTARFSTDVEGGNQLGLVTEMLAGADVITGSSGGDTLLGFGGNDILIGGRGADRLEGGSGRNTASYATASSGVLVELQTPFYNTGDAAGDTYLNIPDAIGSRFNDFLYGDSNVNWLFGGGGNDTFAGKANGDTFDGGIGIDKATYDASNAVRASLLNTALNTGDAKNDIYISIENIAGSSFSDILYGNNLNNMVEANNYPAATSVIDADQLFGMGGNDSLFGYRGNDKLTGGLGADRLQGGLHADQFIFASTAESRLAGGRDIIVDFTRAQGDKIVLTAIDANVGAVNNQAFTFIGAAAFSGRAGELRLQNVGADIHIFADTNGDKVIDMTIISDVRLAFIRTDFWL